MSTPPVVTSGVSVYRLVSGLRHTEAVNRQCDGDRQDHEIEGAGLCILERLLDVEDHHDHRVDQHELRADDQRLPDPLF